MSLNRLDALAAALQRLPVALTSAVGDVVQDNSFLLELDNQQQLDHGLDANGDPIKPDYAPLTVLIKYENQQPSDRVTLRDTGDFYASIVAKVRGQAVGMEATDPKTQELQHKYGKAILGLSDEAVAEFREDVVRPELQQKTRETLGL